MANLAFGRHKVSTSAQAIIARADVPRSSFATSATHKTTFDADYLVPIYVEEILPGDTLNLDITAYVRMQTPVFPVMDNLYVETFFFFVPNRIVWDSWIFMNGEQWQPGDPTDYLTPQLIFTNTHPPRLGNLEDYFGIPPIALGVGEQLAVNAFPFRAYTEIWNQWFRDQNLQDSRGFEYNSPGPDHVADPHYYTLLKRGKRHDYFTSSLPWPQKGNAVSLPLSGSAPIIAAGTGIPTWSGPVPGAIDALSNSSGSVGITTTDGDLRWSDPALEADLTDVLAVSINTMRAAIAMQQLLERDARGGTRYTEVLSMHWGVNSEDSRLMRPEYLGGTSAPLNVTPVAQTSESGTSPLGSLGGAALATGRQRITHTMPEHGFVIGLINVRADISYQQGLHRMWTRRTRFDYAWPVFANLGEQSVRQDEIFLTADPTENETVFGYQERFGEYRFRQSLITSKMRSGITGTLDAWHLAEYFEDPPVLDVEETFIQSSTPMERILAAGEEAEGQQFIADILFNQRITRGLPMRGTPGLVRF